MKNYLKTIFIFFISFTIVYGSFLAADKYPKKIPTRDNRRIFQTAYIAPKSKIVRVEIEIYDDLDKDFYDVEEVTFNDKNIPLQKANASGLRARVYFQVKPGKYDVNWTVSKHKFKWPRSTEYKKEINLTDPDKFAHILIQGEKATVSTS
ncbi:MAG: hypothetical protein KR126chlam6_00519 [Candidatus Anoxychlamydiales bacterium]|nr:hypothetical protein [Candidatus Anoxychlamydiales bacterium]